MLKLNEISGELPENDLELTDKNTISLGVLRKKQNRGMCIFTFLFREKMNYNKI
jgi:hypothetical protein